MIAKNYKTANNAKKIAYLLSFFFLVVGIQAGFAQTTQQTAKDQKQAQSVQPAYKWHTTTRVANPNNQPTKPVKLNGTDPKNQPKGRTNQNSTIKQR